MSAELPRSKRASIMAELDEFFPETKHTERETSLLNELEQADKSLAKMLHDIGELQAELERRTAKVARAVKKLEQAEQYAPLNSTQKWCIREALEALK